MKKRIVIVGLLAIMAAFRVSAQHVENDDMYFNAKDREKLKSADAEGTLNTSSSSPKKKKSQEQEQVIEPEASLNPTDSYSARTINPEYISRSNSAQASETEQSYYIEGYTAPNNYDSYSATKYNSTNPGNYNSSGYNNGNYGSNMYGSSAWGYSPYYGYNNPYMMNPYSGGSGWNLSLGYYSGCGCGSGWNYGLSYGFGNSLYSPYNYYNPYSYYSPYSYGYGGYPTTYYGGSHETSTRNYGKRPSMNSAFVTPIKRTTQSVSTTTNTSGNRMRQSTDEYYVKPARRASSWSTTSPFDSYQRGTSDYSRTRSGGSMPSYSSPSRSNSSYSSPSRSFSSPSHSGGGMGGSPSRSRSRN